MSKIKYLPPVYDAVKLSDTFKAAVASFEDVYLVKHEGGKWIIDNFGNKVYFTEGECFFTSNRYTRDIWATEKNMIKMIVFCLNWKPRFDGKYDYMEPSNNLRK